MAAALVMEEYEYRPYEGESFMNERQLDYFRKNSSAGRRHPRYPAIACRIARRDGNHPI